MNQEESNDNKKNMPYIMAQDEPDIENRAEEYPQVNPNENNMKDSNQQLEDENFEYTIRKGFILKTYGILMTQLVIFTIFVCLSFSQTIKDKFSLTDNKNPWITAYIIFFTILTIAVCIIFTCFQNIARRFPINYILLFTFTLSMSFYCTLICANFKPSIVLTALFLTMGATAGLTLYAYKSKTAFYVCGALLFASAVVLILSVPLFFIFKLHALYYVFGVLLYSVYLVYDTQLILGKFGVEYNIDYYCLAALNLFVDIVYLFIRILYLLSPKNN